MTANGPSMETVDSIRQAAAFLTPYQAPKRKKSRWPTWLTFKRTVALGVVLLIVLSAGVHYLTRPNPQGAMGAVSKIGSAASHNDWQAVYDQLCTSDQQQLTESELHDAGRAALLSIGELDHLTTVSAKSVQIPSGVLHWPAEQVSGQLVPVVGQPSAYTVTVIEERGSWKVCLSAGGYSSSAMGVDVPLASNVSLGF